MGPAHGATDAAPTDDLIAIRLQCRVPWVLPLPDQAVVREQARMVLPAHGPRLPDGGSSLRPRNLRVICLEHSGACAGLWQEQPCCSMGHVLLALQESATLIPWQLFWSSGGVYTGGGSMQCSTAPSSSVCIKTGRHG